MFVYVRPKYLRKVFAHHKLCLGGQNGVLDIRDVATWEHLC